MIYETRNSDPEGSYTTAKKYSQFYSVFEKNIVCIFETSSVQGRAAF